MPAPDYTLSIPMSKQGLTIAQAARSLGVSSRTVRRFIKSGKLQAQLVAGAFGQEYRIPELPTHLYPGKRTADIVEETPGQTHVQTPVHNTVPVMDFIRELQDKNLALAAQLGAATERIKSLENQVKLLTTTRRPWWRRIFGKG